MTLEINKMLTLSTAHITAKTAEFITNKQIASFSSEYGDIIYTGHGEGEEHYPASLKRCLALARKHKCDFLRLDRDGVVIKGLTKYKW